MRSQPAIQDNGCTKVYDGVLHQSNTYFLAPFHPCKILSLEERTVQELVGAHNYLLCDVTIGGACIHWL